MTTKPPPALGYGTAASMARADRPSPKREVTMPRDLWTEIDAAVAARGISRAAWLQEAAREKLEREKSTEPRTKFDQKALRYYVLTLESPEGAPGFNVTDEQDLAALLRSLMTDPPPLSAEMRARLDAEAL